MITTLRSGDATGIYNIHDKPQMRLGEYFCDNDSNRLFVYLRADAAIRQGAAVVSKAVTSISSGVLAAAAGTRSLKFGSTVNLNTLFPRVPNQPQEAEYMIISRVGGNLSGIVYAHTQSEMDVSWDSDNKLLFGTISADQALDVSIPWLVTEATATLRGAVGIAQRAIAQGKYFWALVEGVGKAYVGVAVSAGQPIYLSDTTGDTGEAEPATAAEVQDAYAYTLRAQSTPERLVDVVAACKVKIGIPPYERVPDQQSYKYPTMDGS